MRAVWGDSFHIQASSSGSMTITFDRSVQPWRCSFCKTSLSQVSRGSASIPHPSRSNITSAYRWLSRWPCRRSAAPARQPASRLRCLDTVNSIGWMPSDGRRFVSSWFMVADMSASAVSTTKSFKAPHPRMSGAKNRSSSMDPCHLASVGCSSPRTITAPPSASCEKQRTSRGSTQRRNVGECEAMNTCDR